VDKLPQVLAHRVTHVVSLAAVTIIAVVALAFVSAPWWVYALVIGILVGVTVTLVRFPQLGLEKQHLLEYTMAVVFGRFRPELSQEEPRDKALPEADRPLEERRLDVYEANQGLFLGHYWRPSEEESQVVDIRIFLHDHPHPDGRPTPLEKGAVESVTYYLGPKFPSEDATTKRNSGDAFALDITAYGPVLCLAEVTFNDGSDPLYLNRYIDFPEDLQTSRVAGASAQILYSVEAPSPRWKRLWRSVFGG
jgi:hypothetical protein